MSEKETGFISHLTELRQRLIHTIIFLAILFVVCYFFSDSIYGDRVDYMTPRETIRQLDRFYKDNLMNYVPVVSAMRRRSDCHRRPGNTAADFARRP